MEKYKAFAAALLLAVLPGVALAGGGGSSGRATEATQKENKELLEKIYAKTTTSAEKNTLQLVQDIANAAQTLSHLNHALSMANKVSGYSRMSTSDYTNKVRNVVTATLNLYDSISGASTKIENAYKGHKKSYKDLGFSDIRSFAKSRKKRYMENIYDEMKRGANALDYLESNIESHYKTSKTKIDDASAHQEIMEINAHILNDSRLQLGQINSAIEMLSTAEAQARATQMELDMQEDMVAEAVIEDRQEKLFKKRDVTGDATSLGL